MPGDGPALGGIKPGITYGSTDDFGYHITGNPVHVHDVHGNVVRDILA